MLCTRDSARRQHRLQCLRAWRNIVRRHLEKWVSVLKSSAAPRLDDRQDSLRRRCAPCMSRPGRRSLRPAVYALALPEMTLSVRAGLNPSSTSTSGPRRSEVVVRWRTSLGGPLGNGSARYRSVQGASQVDSGNWAPTFWRISRLEGCPDAVAAVPAQCSGICFSQLLG